MVSIIPLSQFRYAHCQLPLGRGAFRPCVKLPDKLNFCRFTLHSGDACRWQAFIAELIEDDTVSLFGADSIFKHWDKTQLAI